MRLFYPFKAAIPLVATGGALASALSQPSPSSLPSPNNTISSPTSSPTASPDPNAPVCGAGFTYCGYILRDHKNFKEDDIVNAYCAAHEDNCVNGTAKTDPLQALYICLPPGANPLEKAQADSSSRVVPHDTSHNHNDKQSQYQKKPAELSLRDHHADHSQKSNNNKNNPKRTHRHMPNLHILSEEEDGSHFEKNKSQRQSNPLKHPDTSSQGVVGPPTTVQPPQASQRSSSSSSQEPPSAEPPQAPRPSQSSIPSSSTDSTSSSSSSSSSKPSKPSNPSNPGGGDGDSNSNSCASSATIPGNKIELLCSCGRQCLNPLSDHIARCEGPCSS